MNSRVMTVSATLAVAVSTVAWAQTPSPSTRRAREVVALINSATPAAIRGYADTAFAGRMRSLPPQAHVDFFMGQREQGGVEWVAVQEESAGRTTVLLKRKLTGDLIAVMV